MEALVMDVKKGRAVVLTKGGKFLNVKNEDYRRGQKIIIASKRKASRTLRHLSAIAACLVIILGSSAYAGAKLTPWTYLCIDSGEISIEYCLNAFGEVLSAQAYSDEGEALLEKIGTEKYEKMESAADKALSAMDDEGDNLVISVSSRTGSGMSAAKSVEHMLEDSSVEVREVNWSDAKTARSEHRSMGRNEALNKPDSADEPPFGRADEPFNESEFDSDGFDVRNIPNEPFEGAGGTEPANEPQNGFGEGAPTGERFEGVGDFEQDSQAYRGFDEAASTGDQFGKFGELQPSGEPLQGFDEFAHTGDGFGGLNEFDRDLEMPMPDASPRGDESGAREFSDRAMGMGFEGMGNVPTPNKAVS